MTSKVSINGVGITARSLFEKQVYEANQEWLRPDMIEGRTFDITIPSSYTPDIAISPTEVIELKGGYIRRSAAQKLIEFKRQYPETRLIVVTNDHGKVQGRMSRGQPMTIPQFCHKYSIECVVLPLGTYSLRGVGIF